MELIKIVYNIAKTGDKMRIALVYLNNDKYVSRGPGYIASIILDEGYDLSFFDTAYCTVENVAFKIITGKYDLLLLSASTLFYAQAKELASIVKKSLNIKTLLGGIHATIAQESILEECSDIDCICVGEGERFIIEFLEATNNNKSIVSIPNLGYRDINGVVVVNQIYPPTKLDTLPEFKFDLFPLEAIVQNYPLPGFCYVYSTRGCPYNCSYCCNSVFLDLYKKDYIRKRSVDDTITELLYLKKHYPVKVFYFGDEMLLFDKEYVSELFHQIKAEMDVTIGCMVRVETITPSIVKLFEETNCRYVAMGIECGNEKFRQKFLNRRMTNKQIINAFAMLRSIKGMFLTSFNMRGWPVKNDKQLTIETKKLNRLIKPDIVQTSMFYPFPGTKLHDYCVEHDLIDPQKVKAIEETNQEYFSSSVLRS